MKITTLFMIGLLATTTVVRADDVIKIRASDLSAQTNKWNGKTIETMMSCFYADLNEFRCVGGLARIDFESFDDKAAQKNIEKNCDTISKSSSARCNVTFRFVYKANQVNFTNGMTGRLLLVEPESPIGMVVKPAARRR